MSTPITGQGISTPPRVDSALSNTSKNAVQNRVVANALAGAYDATATYAVGDLCIYNGILYECTTAISTAEAWDATHWKTSNFGDAVSGLNRHLNDKQNAPSTAGTAGQVLGLDSNLNPAWMDQTGGGGGGGTSNYSELSNKPQINNVELNGNKTAHDLGLAAQSDIPTVPVQSVNSKTGAVVLNANDLAYDDSATYQAGSVGAELSNQSRQLSDKQDKTIYQTVTGTTLTLNPAVDNTMYLCGELTELTVTAPATGIFAVRFTSGTTPTVVTLNNITMPDDWPTTLDASTTYEINVLNGYGVYQNWGTSV